MMDSEIHLIEVEIQGKRVAMKVQDGIGAVSEQVAQAALWEWAFYPDLDTCSLPPSCDKSGFLVGSIIPPRASGSAVLLCPHLYKILWNEMGP